MFLAARPIVCINDLSERKKPSLSASSIATSDTSGMSSPSLNKLIPTNTSKLLNANLLLFPFFQELLYLNACILLLYQDWPNMLLNLLPSF